MRYYLVKKDRHKIKIQKIIKKIDIKNIENNKKRQTLNLERQKITKKIDIKFRKIENNKKDKH